MATQTHADAQQQVLPRPDERLGSDVVIYDGHCKICTGSVKLLDRLDVSGHISFLSLHDPQVGQIAPDLTHDQMMDELWVIDHKGGRHPGAGGFRYLTRRLGLLWPLMPLLHIPGSLPLWKWCYRRFAPIRYRFGRNSADDCGDACRIHFGPADPKKEG